MNLLSDLGIRKLWISETKFQQTHRMWGSKRSFFSCGDLLYSGWNTRQRLLLLILWVLLLEKNEVTSSGTWQQRQVAAEVFNWYILLMYTKQPKLTKPRLKNPAKTKHELLYSLLQTQTRHVSFLTGTPSEWITSDRDSLQHTWLLSISLLLQENHQRPDFLGILSFTSRSIVLCKTYTHT